MQVLLVTIIVFLSCSENENSSNVNDKVNTLLMQMTLDEKVGQMTQICFSMITEGRNKQLVLDTIAARKAILDYHVGSFLSGTGSEEEWANFIHDIQKIAVEETRLGIPLIIGIDHIHGANYVNEGVIFPHNITLSCSFDKNLVSQAAKTTAIQTGRLGLHWNFAPVLGIAKNPYWPRFYETYGEDPYLCSELGSAFVNAYQEKLTKGFGLSACAKHFIGYSDPESGWDRTPAHIPMQELYEDFLPPFEASIRAGAKTIMLNSGEVNGEPVHISQYFVNYVLREKLSFNGVVLTDIKDILKIVEMHAAAENEKEATRLALEAGTDVSMACDAFRFLGIVKDLIQDGEVSEDRINASVKRILKLKFDLGLFENPYPMANEISRPTAEKMYTQAVKTAEESIVLLKNDGVLPLDKNARILVSGFAADSKKHMNGAWTLEWLGAEENRQPEMMPTLKEALRNRFSNVQYMETPDITNDPGRDAFINAVAANDVIILTIGEYPYSEFKGNISNLTLDENQLKLCQLAAKGDKPVILVLVEGRPRVLNGIDEQASAVLFAGYPGMGGPEAISRILSGETNPSGKLSFTYPKHVGHHTVYYHKFPDTYEYLYPFGHGLSYTDFSYSSIALNDTLVRDLTKPIRLSFNVTNTGDIHGKETVLVYIRDMVGTITRPVKQLVHVEKINLALNETKSMEIEFIPKNIFSHPDATGQPMLEDGEFTFMVEDQQVSIRLRQH